MQIAAWLKHADNKLKSAGIATYRLDALVLLEDVTGKDRAWLLAHPDLKLTAEQAGKLTIQLKQRSNHEPLAFIRGKTEFYGREFVVNRNVLEPRPESETMIELLKSLKLVKNSKILDLGTGSGALAITAKLEFPKAEVLASDIDKKCLAVARQNASKHKVDIKFRHGNLLEPIAEKPDIILANLPYVPDEFKLNEAAKNEPKIAIFGGKDGLDIYRRLFEQINNSTFKPKFILTESLPFQHNKLLKIARQANYKLAKTDDFIQLFSR